MTLAHWPWWAGALSLGTITLAFWWIVRTPLGVSGFWRGVVAGRGDAAVEDNEAAFYRDEAQFAAAMLAATQQEFGDAPVSAPVSAAPPPEPQTHKRAPIYLPWSAKLVFLIALMVGGSLSTLLSGQWQSDLGSVYHSLFGSGVWTWLLLLFGGVISGLGVCIAGGCPSGHGLSGFSRFQPGSLVATPIFFGTAIAVTLLATWVL